MTRIINRRNHQNSLVNFKNPKDLSHFSLAQNSFLALTFDHVIGQNDMSYSLRVIAKVMPLFEL